MSDKENKFEKDEFIPEQLDDEDFEIEKREEKRLKKEKKQNKKIQKISEDENGVNENSDEKIFKRKKILAIISSILVIIAVVLILINIINKNFSSAGRPEDCIKDLCAYFNSKNWEKVNELMDFKGYYVLGETLKDGDYTKFYESYKNLDIKNETYTSFTEVIKELSRLDTEVLNEFVGDTKVTVKNILSVIKIQNTEGLYKIKVEFTVSSQGESQDITDVVYVASIDGKYKIVFGYLPDVILNVYRNIYIYLNYYGN